MPKSGYPTFVIGCPRCGTEKVTADILSAARDYDENSSRDWIAFLVCRHCNRVSLWKAYSGHISEPPSNSDFGGIDLSGAFSHSLAAPIIKDVVPCPAFVPSDIMRIFDEAARCVSFDAVDAAGAMFRKTLDSATRSMLPVEPESVEKGSSDYISWKTSKDLRLRLDWLFDRNLLPSDLKELVSCVHQDGNDAAHSIETIGLEGALDLQDFTVEILEYLYTRPAQIAENIARRNKRRGME